MANSYPFEKKINEVCTLHDFKDCKYINEKIQSETNIKTLGENTAFLYFGGQSRIKAVLKGNKTQTL